MSEVYDFVDYVSCVFGCPGPAPRSRLYRSASWRLTRSIHLPMRVALIAEEAGEGGKFFARQNSFMRRMMPSHAMLDRQYS